MTAVLRVLVAVAPAGALLHPEGAGLADGFALLVFPLTLAGSVVLTWATTGVARWLHERSRRRLVLAIGLAWLISIGRLAAQDIDVGWLNDTWM